DERLRRTLAINLQARSHEVHTAADGATALDLASRFEPDLVILDLGLPDMDGVDVVASLRRRSTVPVLILSARDGEPDKVAALDAGADDYVTKPFGMEELLARMRAALRRADHGDAPDTVETPTLSIDLRAKRVKRDGVEVRLTPTEWHLLEALVRSPGRRVSGRALLHDRWGPAHGDDMNYLLVYMAQLRRNLE